MNEIDRKNLSAFVSMVGLSRARQAVVLRWVSGLGNEWRALDHNDNGYIRSVSWINGTATIDELRVAIREA